MISLVQLLNEVEGKPKAIILAGAPGAGKGTQSNYIVNKYNLFQLSTGEFLRDEIKKKTKLSTVKNLLLKYNLINKNDKIKISNQIPLKLNYYLDLHHLQNSIHTHLQNLKQSFQWFYKRFCSHQLIR